MSQVWNKKLVEIYLDMVKDYEGPALIDWMPDHVAPGSILLELGIGPGVDMDKLSKYYRVTGSDYSPDFLHRYRAFHPKADLVYLDAVTMETEKKYDCICSNKVLVHLTKEELKESLKAQLKNLMPGGKVLHTFWSGQGQEESEGILFASYSQEDLKAIFEEHYDLEHIETYTEEEDGDSILVVAKKRGE
jgi:cyclopropane fatty-acyl-phospholipid synthase-like methyltransferase